MNLRQAVVFSILMENGLGIEGKAPSYILKKLKSASSLEIPETLLDHKNLAKFEKYQGFWKVNLKKEGGEKNE